MLQVKVLLYKISFFLWKVCKRRVSTDDILRNMGILVVSKYYCCDTDTEENLNHLFLIAPIALRLLRQFVTCARFSLMRGHIYTTILDWQKHTKTLRAKAFCMLFQLSSSGNYEREETSLSMGKQSFIESFKAIA